MKNNPEIQYLKNMVFKEEIRIKTLREQIRPRISNISRTQFTSALYETNRNLQILKRVQSNYSYYRTVCIRREEKLLNRISNLEKEKAKRLKELVK